METFQELFESKTYFKENFVSEDLEIILNDLYNKNKNQFQFYKGHNYALNMTSKGYYGWNLVNDPESFVRILNVELQNFFKKNSIKNNVSESWSTNSIYYTFYHRKYNYIQFEIRISDHFPSSWHSDYIFIIKDEEDIQYNYKKIIEKVYWLINLDFKKEYFTKNNILGIKNYILDKHQFLFKYNINNEKTINNFKDLIQMYFGKIQDEEAMNNLEKYLKFGISNNEMVDLYNIMFN